MENQEAGECKRIDGARRWTESGKDELISRGPEKNWKQAVAGLCAEVASVLPLQLKVRQPSVKRYLVQLDGSTEAASSCDRSLGYNEVEGEDVWRRRVGGEAM